MRLPVLVLSALASVLGAESSAGAQEAAPLAWRLQPRVKIGAVDGRNALGSVQSVSVGRDGFIYVADGMERGVRVYTVAGQLLRIIGRQGSGPGEFQAVGRLSWIGDTLVVEDPKIQRYSLFDRAGRFVDVFRPAAGMFLNIGVFADRSILARPRVDSYKHEGAPPMPLLRVVGSNRTDTVARITAHGSGTCAGDRIRVCLGTPIGTADIPAADPRGMFFTVVSGRRADGPDRRAFSVTRLSPRGDTLMKTSIRYVPEAVPRSYEDSLSAHWIAVFTNPPGGRPRMTRQEATVVVRSGLQVPRYYPPVYAVTIAENGDTWLETRTSRGALTWLVLDRSGRQKAPVTGAPAGYTLHYVTGDTAWGVITDELDVPYVLGLTIVAR
jgi:hypothetical protein